MGLGAPFEALNDDLFDVHVCAGAVDSTAESKKIPEYCDQFYKSIARINMEVWC